MSLGPQQVLEAAHVAVIVSGAKKRDLVQEFQRCTSFDSGFPLSIVYDRANQDATELFVTPDALPAIA
jgi:6-phosphogluconolactonase/glucosamine-6-phosphate isomerase/deaminase